MSEEVIRALAHIQIIIGATGQAWAAADRAGSVEDAAARRALLSECATEAKVAKQEADAAREALESLGGAPPPPLDLEVAIPLDQLDTPDTRALLIGLGALLPIAERIDAARGRSLPEPVGGSAGIDLAEDLAQLIARLELEIYGPSERVTGGRE